MTPCVWIGLQAVGIKKGPHCWKVSTEGAFKILREKLLKVHALLKSFSRGIPNSRQRSHFFGGRPNRSAVKVDRTGIRNANTEYGQVLW